MREIVTNRKYCTFILFLFFFTALNLSLHAQEAKTIGEVLPQLSNDGAKAYAGPVAKNLGVNLNGAWFDRSPQAKFLGFTLEIGAVGMLSDIRDIDRRFSAAGTFRFDSIQTATILTGSGLSRPSGTDFQSSFQREFFDSALVSIARQTFNIGFSGATIFGDKNDSLKITLSGRPVTISYRDPLTNQRKDSTVSLGGSTIPLPFGGVLSPNDLPFNRLPLVLPQVSIGTILGTQVTVRYIPQIKGVEALGKYDMLGYGFQHNPAVWLTPLGVNLPFEISVGYFTQKITFESNSAVTSGTVRLKATSTAYGGMISKAFGMTLFNIVPYVGYLRETAKTEFGYDFETDVPFQAQPLKVPVFFEVDGGNTQRWTVGLSIRFLLMSIHVDYNFANTNSITAGIMANLSFEK
ncbi:MAG: DUF6588 family protein [Chloroherpetonaceae bacterium]|nr:DUF6588 family protein [Chloroherpetonaceae bacterium]